MFRQTENRGREGRRRGLLTLFLLCATYVGWPRQANRQHCWENLKTIPQRNSGLLYERESESQRGRERHHSWQFGGRSLGCAAYLFGWLLPLSENKHVPVIWQHSGRTGQRSAFKTLTLYGSFSSHICTVMLDYITSTNNFLFSPSFDWWLFQKGLVLQFVHTKRDIWGLGIVIDHQGPLLFILWSYVIPLPHTCGLSFVNKLREPVWACCHLKAAK